MVLYIDKNSLSNHTALKYTLNVLQEDRLILLNSTPDVLLIFFYTFDYTCFIVSGCFVQYCRNLLHKINITIFHKVITH